MRKVFVGFPVIVLLLAISPAFSAPTLDQYQNAGGGPIALLSDLGQTFTAGLSGLLDHIEVMAGGFDPATVEIRDTIGGMPGSTVLGSVTGFTMPLGWHSIDFLSQNIPMSAGTMYSIVVRPSGPPVFFDDVGVHFWVPFVDADPYAAGRLWVNGSSGWVVFDLDPTALTQEADMQFRTYVETGPTIPAPGAMVLAGIGATLVGWLRRRRTV